MELKFDRFTIKGDGEYNFVLYETVQKGTFRGEAGEGTIDKLIGYYGSLGGALIKAVNQTFLTSPEHFTAETLLEAISTLETKLESVVVLEDEDEL